MKRSSFVATLATVALSISAILVGVTSANASVTLPKGAFLPCSAGGGAYCIDSVSITPTGGKLLHLLGLLAVLKVLLQEIQMVLHPAKLCQGDGAQMAHSQMKITTGFI
jgi:hypothetical protein